MMSAQASDSTGGRWPVTEILNIGEVKPSRNTVTSKIEETVRVAVLAAGYAVPEEKLAVVCRHPDDDARRLALTPDVVLVEHKIAIEVDPLGEHDGRGYSHLGEEEKDHLRNSLLTQAGWTVIRVRLGATRGAHIGKRDVVVESSGLTRDAAQALVEAIDDAIHRRRARVRLVRKTKSPAPAQRRSSVVNIGINRYTDGGHFFGWYPRLDGPKRIMRLCVNGRYLYTHGGKEMRYVAEVRLDQVPQNEWKDRLQDILRDLDPDLAGTTKWPWGEALFVCDPDNKDGREIAERHAYKSTIDDAVSRFTTNCDSLAAWNSAEILTDEGAAIARLHDDAITLGYRIVEVVPHTGRHGPYQSIVVTRSPEPATD
jgi:hypothetical protein